MNKTLSEVEKKKKNTSLDEDLTNISWKDGFINFDLYPQFEDREFREKLLEYNKKIGLTFPLGFSSIDGLFEINRAYFSKFPLDLIVNSTEINARGNAIHVEHAKRLGKSLEKVGLIKPIVLDPMGRVPEGGHREFGALSIGAEYIPSESSVIEGGKISSIADSQTHYADLDIAIGVANGFSLGLSIEELASASSKSPRTVRFFINLLNATPELIYALKNDLISITHGCEIARLNKNDQSYELKEFLNSKNKLSARKLRKKVTAGIKISQNNPTVEDLRKMNLISNFQISEKKFNYFLDLKTLIIPTYEEEFKLDSNFSVELNLEPVSKDQRSNPQKVLERLTLLNKSKFLNDGFFQDLEDRLELTYLKPLKGEFDFLIESIENCAKKNNLRQTVLTSEEAKHVLKIKRESEKSVLMKYDHIYVPNGDISEILPSENNVRGSRIDTIESAKDLVDSIREYGVQQAILCHINSNGQIETVVGNRRYEGTLLSERKTIPYYLIKKTLSEREILEFQLIEDSQKLYTVLEKSTRFARNLELSMETGLNYDQALEDITKASNLSKEQILRYLSYNDKLSPEVKSLYSFTGENLLRQDLLDELVKYDSSKQKVLTPISIFRGNYNPNKFREIEDSIYNTQDSLFGDEVDTNLILLNEAVNFIKTHLR